MGHRGSTLKDAARTLGCDLELSRGPLPATGTKAVLETILPFLETKPYSAASL